MKTKPAIAGVAACTVMLALAGCSPDRSGVERPLRWEYKVLEIENAYHRVENEHAMSRDKADREKEKVVKLMPGMFQWDPDKLEALGRDGWELVAVIPQAETVYGGFSGDPERANTRTAAVHLFFKRPAKR